MARQTVVQLIDDLDGSEAQGAVAFGLDGTGYEIDLSSKHAKELRDVLALYVAHGRKVGRIPRHRALRLVGGRAPARADREQVAAIREWARASGYKVSDRGRLSAEVMEAFHTSGGKPKVSEPEPTAKKAAPRRPAKAAKKAAAKATGA
jgi:Lsr2